MTAVTRPYGAGYLARNRAGWGESFLVIAAAIPLRKELTKCQPAKPVTYGQFSTR